MNSARERKKALRPEIVDAKENVILRQAEDLQIWCYLSPDVVPSSVEFVLSFAAASYTEGEPITTYKTVRLEQSTTPNLWFGDLSGSEIQRSGSYNIFYVAIKEDGLPGIDLVSSAVVRMIDVTQGVTSARGKWLLYR